MDALEAVGNTVEGNAHKWKDYYVIWQELLGDVLMFVGPSYYNQTWGAVDEGRVDYGTYPTDGVNYSYGSYNFPDGMATSRWFAEKAWSIATNSFVRDSAVDELPPTILSAQLKLGHAFNNMYLGLFSCEGVMGSVDDGAEMYLDVQIYDSAAALFTQVIDIMGDIDPVTLEENLDRDFLNAARTSRALMRMLTGDYEGAVEDASAVPDGFKYDALHSTSYLSYNEVYRYIYLYRWAGVLPWLQENIIGNNVADPWTGAADERMPVTYRGTSYYTGDDVYAPYKYTYYDDPIPMVHSDHARLVEAEAKAMSGDFGGAVSVLNALRARADLGAIPTPSSPEEMGKVLLSERFAELFMEGWRVVDLHRFGLVREVFESLNDPARRGIGRPTKFPGSQREAWLNPAIEDNATQRCHPNA